MHRPFTLAAAVLAATMGGASSAAAQDAPSPAASDRLRLQPLAAARPAKPYSRLFALPRTSTGSPFQLEVRPNSARRFFCHIIVLPADPSVDPTFEKPLADRTTRFTMPVLQPTCE